MKILYASQRVERYFSDYGKLRKKLPFEWVKTIKKLMSYLEAAEKFGDFLALGLGKPELLSGCYENLRYSLHVTANVRLIIELDADMETVKICTTVEVKGVSDYHGDKENWYIP